MGKEFKELFLKQLVPIIPNRKNPRKYGRYISRTKPKTFTNGKRRNMKHPRRQADTREINDFRFEIDCQTKPRRG